MTTANAGFPEISQGQADKHITHNTALRAIDALVGHHAISINDTTPPGGPSGGDVYIIASAGATGAWAGQENDIAHYSSGAWNFITPKEGWLFYAQDEDKQYVFDGTSWSAYVPSGGVETQDEGTQILASSTALDFVGAGVTATDGGSGKTTVTIPGGGSGVETQDEGTQVVASSTILDFVGAGVVATDGGSGKTTVTIAGGGSGVETQDEGTQVVASSTILDFVGSGVVATDGGSGKTTVTISGGASFNGASAYHNTTQSLSHNTTSALALNSEEYDTDTYHDNATNNSRLTIPETGYYSIKASLHFASNSTGIRMMGIKVDDTDTYGQVLVDAASSSTTRLTTSFEGYFTASSYVELVALQTSGGSLDIQGSGASNYPRLIAHKIG